MATTTNYGWTTPDDTALVKDGAAAIRTLGTSVDTTTKNLNPSTTLGDIEYRSSTANTNTRLGIGSTGQILAVSGGVPAWTTPASAAAASASSNVATSESTTSTSYTDLTTAGPAVTITTGTKALVIVSARAQTNSGATSYGSYAVSGATTIAANDDDALEAGTITNNISRASRLTTLTAGSNTFTMKYRTSPTRTGTFEFREIIVIDLGS